MPINEAKDFAHSILDAIYKEELMNKEKTLTELDFVWP